MKEHQLIRLSFIVDEIINNNFLRKYSRQKIYEIIDRDKYKLDRYELEYVLLKISKKLNNKNKINHVQSILT